MILVPGNHGERFVREQMGVDTQAVVTMSNFVGYMIEEAVRLGILPDSAGGSSWKIDQNRRRDLSYP
ncbi:cobalt-precorrin-6A synthase [Salmonella enterica subsp. enterica serovar Typhimurium]|nr:cobalt-precorrin-6A synthase [Salmonella enterica subsp. enterica serovar Typhimurium]